MHARDFLFLGYPLTVMWACLAVGVACLFFRRTLRWGKLLCLVCFVGLTVCGSSHWMGAALQCLEAQYVPVSDPQFGPAAVVVLGGGATAMERPWNQRLSGATLARLVEGVRLCQATPGRRLWLSGAGLSKDSEADLMAKTAVLMGIKPDQIGLDENSKNTAEQALWMKKTFKKNPFYVVTSASHMPRVMAALNKLEAQGIPAPCDFLTMPQGASVLSVLPTQASSHGLRLGEIWMSEWLGRGKTLHDLP